MQDQYSGDQKKVAEVMSIGIEWKPNAKELNCLVDCAPAEKKCPTRCIFGHKAESDTCLVENSACYNCLDECSGGTVTELLNEFLNSSPKEQKKCSINCYPTKLQCPARCVDEHISEGEDNMKCVTEKSGGCFKCILEECVNGAETGQVIYDKIYYEKIMNHAVFDIGETLM